MEEKHILSKEEKQQIKEELDRKIREWKEKYHAIYMTEVKGIVFIWRGLSLSEFRKANEWFDDDYERAEYVCKQCVLEPIIEDYSDEIYAGIPEVLTENILRESGFTSDTKKLDLMIQQYEAQMTTFDNQIACIIKEAFPEYTIEEIESWTMEKMLWHYARAKWMLENLRGVMINREEVTPQ